MGERESVTDLAQAFLRWLPLHVAVPVGLVALERAAGRGAVVPALAGMHVAFPIVYMLSDRISGLSFADLLTLLALNHAVMWLLWWGLSLLR